MMTLLIVDDQPAVVEALKQCFSLEPDILIIGRAENGEEALEAVRKLHPDIVLSDIRMPVMDGITATLAIKDCAPETRVVILSIYDDSHTRKQALDAGAREFVAKHEDADAIVAAVRRAAMA
jgi:DNA-binding NarL/FixJ family response regulator